VTSASLIAARGLAESEINVAAVTGNLETYYANNGVSVVAPKFQEWLDPSNSGKLPQRLAPVSGLAFTDLTNAKPGQPITSNSVSVSGLGAGVVVAVSVSNGTTLVKNGVAVTGTLSTLSDGDTVALRITGPGYLLTTQATITAGTSSATWHVTGESLGGSITGLNGAGLSLQDNGGNTIVIAPGSTTFSFPGALALGAAYEVTVAAEPTTSLQVCSVVNGTGTVGAVVGNIGIACSTPLEQLFVSDRQGNSAAFLIDSTTGAVGPSGTPTGLGSGSTQIATDRAGKFLFALNPTGLSIYGYTIGASTGALVPVKGSPFSVGSNSISLPVIEPAGKFLYVAMPMSTPSISYEIAYAIDGTTGAISQVPGSPFAFPTGIRPDGPCVTTIKFLYCDYASSAGPWYATIFSIDATTGALAYLGNSVALQGGPPGAPINEASDPTGKFFYVGVWYSGTRSTEEVYTIDGTTGVLTLVGSTQAPTNQLWNGIALAPSGKFAYLLSSPYPSSPSYIHAFSVDATSGALTPLPYNSVATGPGGYNILFDLTGKYLYVAGKGSIAAYTFDATTGALTPVPGSPFPSALDPVDILVTAIP
jgi:6-phosphogluconolactonase (cycloisomerase 2 family)